MVSTCEQPSGQRMFSKNLVVVYSTVRRHCELHFTQLQSHLFLSWIHHRTNDPIDCQGARQQQDAEEGMWGVLCSTGGCCGSCGGGVKLVPASSTARGAGESWARRCLGENGLLQ
jgi:hypothetical protein